MRVFHFIDSSLRIISFYFRDKKNNTEREREKENWMHCKARYVKRAAVTTRKKREKNETQNTKQINVYTLHTHTVRSDHLIYYFFIYLFCFVFFFLFICCKCQQRLRWLLRRVCVRVSWVLSECVFMRICGRYWHVLLTRAWYETVSILWANAKTAEWKRARAEAYGRGEAPLYNRKGKKREEKNRMRSIFECVCFVCDPNTFGHTLFEIVFVLMLSCWCWWRHFKWKSRNEYFPKQIMPEHTPAPAPAHIHFCTPIAFVRCFVRQNTQKVRHWN